MARAYRRTASRVGAEMTGISPVRIIKPDHGFALILVLWALVLLSGLALTAAAAVRTDSHAVRNLMDAAAARHLAQAAIFQTITNLLDKNSELNIDPRGEQSHRVDILGHPVEVRVIDECAKVDINTGWSGLIAGLVGSELPGKAGFEVVQAILDWRDPDHRRRPRGAEDDDYVEAGYAHGAGDSFFAVIDELQLVKGMTPALYRRLAPHITVDCLNAGVDAAVASPIILASVPDVDPAALSAYLDARRLASANEIVKLAEGFEKDSKYFEISSQTAFEIVATARLKPEVRARWRAVIWLTGDDTSPFRVRRWEGRAVTDDGG